MSFFIRKSFRAGPVRVNLSKGGVGLSAGVTGARLGVNRHGAYVAGGRHGLYYRERLNKSRKGKTTQEIPHGGPVELFRETGNTYEASLKIKSEPCTEKEPKLPNFNTFWFPWALTAFGLVIFGFVISSAELVASAPVILIIGALYALVQNGRVKTALDGLSNLEETAQKQKNPYDQIKKFAQTTQTPGPFKKFRDYHLAALTLELDARNESTPIPGEPELTLRMLEVNPDDIKTVKVQTLHQLFDEFAADGLLSEQQEEKLLTALKRFDLPDENTADIRASAQSLSKIREELQKPLEPIETGINLKRGEKCYFITEARFLNKRVLNSFQRDNIRYNETGYEIDMEGTLYLTDRRLLMVADGTREYRLNKVLDVILSLEDHAVHLILDGRANPVIVSCPDVTILAGKIEQIVEA